MVSGFFLIECCSPPDLSSHSDEVIVIRSSVLCWVPIAREDGAAMRFSPAQSRAGDGISF